MSEAPDRVPPPPPPPPAMSPVAPPPRAARRRFGRFLTTFVLAVVVSMTYLALNLKKSARNEQDIVAAEKFADALRFGPAVIPDGDGKTTGYEAAFGLLSDNRKDEIGPQGFIAMFDDLSARHGFLQATKRIDRETGRAFSRKLFFHLIYSGESGTREIIEMTVTMEPVGRQFRVADFVLSPAHGDEK